MKETAQRIFIAFLLLVVTALALKSCFKKQKENAILKDVVEIKQDSTQYWRDQYLTEHASKRIAEGNLASIRVAYSDLLDTLKSRVGTKDNSIQGATVAGTIASGTIKPLIDTIRGVDSLNTYKFKYNDKWLDLQGEISSNPTISYQFRDSLVFTTYKKRTGLFKKETYIDGYSLNPAVHITGITGIRISSEKNRRFGIGPYLGYGWNGSSWTPSAGISIHYSLVKF